MSDARIYYEADCDPSLLDGKTIAVIGYGSQGHAHALNNHDSGNQVIVGARPDSRAHRAATDDGLTVATVAEATAQGDIVMILVPDHVQAPVYREEIAPNLRPGSMLMFAHGFNIRFGGIEPAPDVDVAMIAPKGPGHLVRRQYTAGIGVPGLVAVHQDATGNALGLALAYGHAIGCARGGLIETTFTEETETDLFGEQAVLCGGTTQLVQMGFDTLVEAGYQPEIAYFECLHELKLIVDLMWEGGLAGMRYSISDTAEYGDLTRGPNVIDEHVRENMRKILSDIRDGTFAREMMDEEAAGRPRFTALRASAAELADRGGRGSPSGHDAVDPGGGQGEGESLTVAPCRRVRLADVGCGAAEPARRRLRPYPRAVRRPPRVPGRGRGGGARGCRTAAARRRPRRPARPRVLHGRPAGLDGPRPGDAARTPGRRRAPRALRHRRRRPLRRSGGRHRGRGVAARRHRVHARPPLPALSARARRGCCEPPRGGGQAGGGLHRRAGRPRSHDLGFRGARARPKPRPARLRPPGRRARGDPARDRRAPHRPRARARCGRSERR